MINEQKWNANFKLVKEFKKKFNRLPKHKEKYKGVAIGNWTNNQQYYFRRGALSNTHIRKLESIGLNLGRLQRQWNAKFELLKEFINEFNRFPKQSEHYKGIAIGIWTSDQKQYFKKGKLSEERIQKLESIGFTASNSFKEQWEYKFELLKEFKEEFGKFPAKYTVYKGIQIGQWIHNQRQKFMSNTLEKEQIEKLESTGIRLHTTNMEAMWNSKFELVKEFKEEFGRLPNSKESYKGIELGKWLFKHRYIYKDNKLPEERLRKLESIGFSF